VTAISKRDAESFVAAPPAAVFLVLVYGGDAGLVRERAVQIAAKRVDDRRDPFQFVELSGDAVSADPLVLLDEANTVPMFGGRRAILVESGAKSVAPAVEMLLAAPPPDCTIIITAGALKKDAPLRKLVEPSKIAAALECQPDEDKDLHGLIERTLHEHGLHADAEAMGLLTAALGEDRMMSRGELAKLALYMHGRSKVEAQDVEAIVAHAATIAGDRVMLAAFSGDKVATIAGYEELLTRGGDGQALIIAAMRYALALHRGRAVVDRDGGQTRNAQDAFYKAGFGSVHQAMREAHLKGWTQARVTQIVEFLRTAQTRARARGETADMEAARALLFIAQTATRC